MKVIISHDVDHISPREHCRDLIVPKFVARFGIEWLLGYTRWREFRLAVRSLWSDSWQHTEELMSFDEEHGVPSTFFVAVRRGRNLAYSFSDALEWIGKIRRRGFEVGVHGIEYSLPVGAREELDLFREISDLQVLGVRMHNIGYSRSAVLLTRADVLRLKDIGYSYSTTTFSEDGPWSSGSFWEFPVHLMDCHVFEFGRPWKTRTLAQVKKVTMDRLASAAARDVRFFSLLFHDWYFCDYYRDYKEWYVWLVEYLEATGCPLCSYRDALSELNGAAA